VCFTLEPTTVFVVFAYFAPPLVRKRRVLHKAQNEVLEEELA
jgi:hypothetical protein